MRFRPKNYVVLSKNNELSYAFDNEKLLEENEAVQANGVGVMTKLQNMNKRVLAVVLAIVFVLTVVPTAVFVSLRGKADPFYTLNPVQVYTRINGVLSDSADTTINAGEILDNIDAVDVTLPEGAEFIKAILLETDGVTETEIAAVGNIDNKDFYSLYEENSGSSQAGDIGTATKEGQKLVLVYANKYALSVQKNGEGTYKTSAGNKNYVYAGENFRVSQIEPEIDYNATSIQYSTDYTNGTINVSNGEATIPASEIVGNLHVIVNFSKISSYTITDRSNASGNGNGGITEGQGNSTLDKSEFKSRWNPEPIPVTEDGSNTKTFWMYSDSNSGGSTYILNMFRINGQEVEVSSVNKDAVSQTLPDGTHVEIAVDDTINGQGMYWLDNKPNATLESQHDRDGNFSKNGSTYTFNGSWRKTRTIYRVTVSNVHKNLNVEYNFKKKNNREIIIKNRQGIAQTASGRETVDGVSYEYFFNSQNTNIYPAYYKQMGIGNLRVPSANLILYKVMPGFNPYVYEEARVYYVDDNGNSVLDVNAILTNNIGTPEEAISTATAGEVSEITYQDYTKFDTQYRQWGGRNKSPSIHNDNNERDGWFGDYFILSAIGRRDDSDDWYAIALKENPSYNQQLYLALKPYSYRIQLDLDGGTLNAVDTDDYKNTDENGYREQIDEKVIHINDESPFTYLPSEEPTREGYYFKGWQQVVDGNKTVGDLLPAGTRVIVNASTVENTIGEVRDENHYYRYVAVWEAKEVSDKTTATVNVYVEDPEGTVEANGKQYRNIYTNSSVQNVGDAVILNNHSEEIGEKADYYYINLASNTVADLVNQTDENLNPNILNLYYDYKMYDLTINNSVLGYPETDEYEVTITVTPDEDSPLADISLEDARALFVKDEATAKGELIKNQDGTFTYSVKMKDSDTAILSLPYNWDYSIEVAENDEDYKTTISPGTTGTIKKNTNIEITNIQNNSGVKTEKTIELQQDGTYKITLKSWATGATYSKPITNSTPLDIVMVIDQSGSMGTEDMATDVEYEVVKENGVPKKSWTIEQATNAGEQYYYTDGAGNYYPVQAMEGPLYVEAEPISASKMFGAGNDAPSTFSIGFIEDSGSPVFFNIPTKYYALYNGTMKNVYSMTIGGSLEYITHPYIYTNSATEETSGANNDGTRWRETIKWFNANIINALRENGSIVALWEDSFLYEAHNKIFLVRPDGYPPSQYWPALSSDVRFVKQDGTLTVDGSSNSAESTRYNYSWITSAPTISGLYLQQDGQTYNGIGYNNGTTTNRIGNTINFEGNIVYTDVLYRAKGKSRVSALQENVAGFVNSMAKAARKSGAPHRMAIVGFAGNKVPAYSSGNTAYDTTYYDYTNTGLFLNGEFKNYEQMTGYNEYNGTQYINRHYYIKINESEYIPIRYINGNWQTLTGETAINSVAVKNLQFYEPAYNALQKDDYEAALVPIADDDDSHYYDTTTQRYSNTNKNGVNDQLDQSISEFGNYGGTYTSYGMTMANNIFRYNDDDDGNRERVVIVFTDGEPGSNKFDSAIAGEATVDSNIAKTTYGARVYTIGLFKNDPEGYVETFMEELSSEYSADLNPVTAGAQNIGNLDPTKAYYYKEVDAGGNETGKTFSVSAIHNGESTLGWWKTTIGNDGTVSYSSVTPMSNSGAGNQKFYKNGSEVKAEDVQTSQEYDDNNGNKIRYEYRWYDSNNAVKNPIGSDTTSPNKVQFYEIGTKNHDDSKDYYFRAENAASLDRIFDRITSSIASMTVETSLDASNSLMKDIITDNFDASHARVSAKAVEAKSENGVITETGSEDNLSNPDLNGNTVTYQGFDYSSNYIGDDRQTGNYGKKLVVTIENLEPLKTGWNLESNTNESGVYERQFDENEDEIDPQMLQAFEIPKVNRPGYTLVTDGDDTDASYTVKLKLVDKDGTVLTQGQWERLNDETPLSQLGTPDADGFAEWVSTQSTGDADNVRTDTVVLEDVFRNLPEGYKVYAKVSKNEADNDLFNYSLKLNNGSSTDGETTVPDWNEPFELANGDEIEIDSTRKTVAVTINEVTVGSGDADYSDPNKDFDVVLTLKDTSNRGVNDTLNGVTFTDGEAVIKMRNGQTRIINIPKGYSLEIDVDKDSQTPYTDSYKLNGNALDGSKFNATTINEAAEITVINTIDAPIPTGMSDNDSIVGILLGIFGTLSLAGGAGYVVRKRKNNA